MWPFKKRRLLFKVGDAVYFTMSYDSRIVFTGVILAADATKPMPYIVQRSEGYTSETVVVDERVLWRKP